MKALHFLSLVLLAACSASPGDDDALPSSEGAAAEAPAEAARARAPTAGELELRCPTKAPFDTSIPGLADLCTQKVLVAAVGGMKLKLSRDDGATWRDSEIDPSATDAQIFGFASGNGVVAALTRRGVFTSVDLVTWSLAEATAGGFFGGAIAFANGTFVAGGNAGTFASTDGLTWAGYRSGDRYPSGAVADMRVREITFMLGTWLMVGDRDGGAVVRASPDGYGWSPDRTVGQTRTGSFALAAATVTSTVVVGECCGKETEGLIARSTDGAAWTANIDPTLKLRRLIADGTTFYGFADDRAVVTSTDGAAWSKVGTTPAAISVAAAGSGTLFAGDATRFFVSADAVAWRKVLELEAPSYNGRVGIVRALKPSP